MKGTIEIFVELGRRLRSFGQDEHSQRVLAAAVAANEWFSPEDIRRAIDAICEEYLDEEKLHSWSKNYTPCTPRRVAIIMAGNIPLVGFFDLMCVLLCGHTALVKPSSKDCVLTEYIIDTLRNISPEISIESYNESADVDMIIATGGSEAAKFFRTRYADIPALIRGSRHSIAVLDGKESGREIYGLQQDIFSYNGLGCRNVSLIFLPRGTELIIEPPTMNSMYRGNYLHNKAMRQMMAQPFTDFGECIAVEELGFSLNISQINYCYYDNINDVAQWIAENDEQLQCIVSHAISHPRKVAFGRAQYPTLADYADGVDVMEFLTT